MAKSKGKGCLVAVGIIAMLVILGATWWNQQDNMGSDTEFESIVAFAAPKPLPPIREADNWYPLIKSFSTTIPFPDPLTDQFDDDAFHGRGGQAILNLSRDIHKRPNFEAPNKSPYDFDLIYGSRVRALTKYLAAHARRSFASGDWQTALEDLEIVDHIGVTVCERGMLVDWLVGRAVTFMASRERADAFLEGKVPREKCIEWASRPVVDRREGYLQALRRDLSDFSIPILRTGRMVNPLRDSNSQEPDKPPSLFDFSVYSFDAEESMGADVFYFGRYQRIETAKALAEVLKAKDEEIRAPYPSNPSRSQVLLKNLEKLRFPVPTIMEPDSLQEKMEILKYRLALRSRPNEKGQAFLDLMPLSYGDSERNARSEELFLRISAAIGAFRLDQKRFPATLDELVQRGLLEQAPIDPFDGAPVRYDVRRKILWAVGNDIRDDNGKAGDDLVWRLTPRPNPPFPPTGPSPASPAK
ncbi:MAG: hypothetical protein ACOYON_10995 [Fimbriimonas sp.]